jgi:type II secretory pathway pseudopilin PulG
MKQRSAFTLIEIVIDIAVVAMVATALLGLIVANVRSALSAQMKVVAINIASQRLEEIRNLPYEQVATQHGAILPQGTLLDQEDITVDGFHLIVHTIAQYQDDPYDGLSPADTAPNDYKKVTVQVSQFNKTVPLSSLTTDISSNSIETTGNTGVLSVNVVDGANNPVDATVTVVNNQVNPPVNITAYINADGHITIPLLTPGQGYKVTVTKAGFSTDTTIAAADCSTLPASPEATGNPTILVQQATSITMQIRCLVDLETTMRNTTGQIQPGVWIRVRSTRRTCLDPLKTKLDEWKQTDSNGKVNFSQIENDKYKYENE